MPLKIQNSLSFLNQIELFATSNRIEVERFRIEVELSEPCSGTGEKFISYSPVKRLPCPLQTQKPRISTSRQWRNSTHYTLRTFIPKNGRNHNTMFPTRNKIHRRNYSRVPLPHKIRTTHTLEGQIHGNHTPNLQLLHLCHTSQRITLQTPTISPKTCFPPRTYHSNINRNRTNEFTS